MEGDLIFGVGIDAVPIARMKRALERTPGFAERVFTPHELATAADRASRHASLAARFAAKEACRKALRETLPWCDVEVKAGPDRAPSLAVAGHDAMRFHLSLTHTDDLAMAVVVAEVADVRGAGGLGE